MSAFAAALWMPYIPMHHMRSAILQQRLRSIIHSNIHFIITEKRTTQTNVELYAFLPPAHTVNANTPRFVGPLCKIPPDNPPPHSLRSKTNNKKYTDMILWKLDAIARLGYAAFALDMFGTGHALWDRAQSLSARRPITEDRSLMQVAWCGNPNFQKGPFL